MREKLRLQGGYSQCYRRSGRGRTPGVFAFGPGVSCRSPLCTWRQEAESLRSVARRVTLFDTEQSEEGEGTEGSTDSYMISSAFVGTAVSAFPLFFLWRGFWKIFYGPLNLIRFLFHEILMALKNGDSFEGRSLTTWASASILTFLSRLLNQGFPKWTLYPGVFILSWENASGEA